MEVLPNFPCIYPQAAVEAKPDMAVGPLYFGWGVPIVLGKSLQVLRPLLASQEHADALWAESERLCGIHF